MAGTAWTRRAFLRRAGLGAAGVALGGPALLAGCSNASPAVREVRVFNEPLAIDDNTQGIFEAQTGIFLRYHEYTDPAAYLRDVSAGLRARRDIGADVVVVPDLQAAQMIEAGFAQRLPFRPAASLMPAAFANPRFDPGRQFSLPWSATMVGLAYDQKHLSTPPSSAAALFDPAFAGKVVLARDPAATLGMVLLASGHDPATVTAAQAAAAVARVRGAVASGQVRSFAGDEYIDDLATGRALVAIGRADEIRDGHQLRTSLRLAVPHEGGMLESLDMVIPVGARNVSEAKAFVQNMFRPAASSRIASFTNTLTTVNGADGALAGIDVKSALDPLVVPPPAVWARLRIWGGTSATDSATAAFASLAAAHPG